MAEQDSLDPDLRAANALLHDALLAAERRAETLAELSRVLADSPDPLALVQRAVDLVARATGAVGAFVYLWDPAKERLVLRAATEGRQRPFVDTVALRLGEGVIGWAALMRRHVVINEQLQDDPRFLVLPVPGLGDTEFRAMLATPVRAAGDHLVGVVVLYSLAEHAFSDEDVSLVAEVAALVASGVHQAETVEDLRRASTAARFLLGFDRAAFASRTALVQELARRVPALVPADVCVVEVLGGDDEPAGQVAVAVRVGAAPSAGGRWPGEHHVRLVDRTALEHLLATHTAGQEPFVQTVRLGAGPPLGMLTFYAEGAFTAADRAMAEAIAAQAGAALAASSGEGRSSALASLRDGDDAHGLRLLRRLGWRRLRALPVVLRLAAGPSGDAADVHRLRIQLEAAGAFVIPGPSGAPGALVPVGADEDRLPADVVRALAAGGSRSLAIGVGDALDGTAPAIGAAFRAAWSAALWAEAEGAPFTVVHHVDVARLRSLPAVTASLAPVLRPLLEELAALGDHDARTGSELLRTLDVYLARRGMIDRAAAELGIHRNTLRRRLRRIEDITGRRVDAYDDWLAAALAARLVGYPRSTA